MREQTIALGVAVLLGASAQAFAQEGVERLFEAARSLKWSALSKPDNAAYVLEKQETVPAPVALIFGYADNRTACQSLAAILIASRREGTFKCHPIY